MLSFPNYRISLKKNNASKTLTNFSSLHQLGNRLRKIKNDQNKNNCDQKTKKNISATQKLAVRQKKTLNSNFSFDSSDKYIKRLLMSKGWQQVPANLSNVRLKWFSIMKNHHFSNLQPGQLVNHFKDSYKLTTKLGLHNILSNPHNQILTNQHGKNQLTIYPRSYDFGAQFQVFKKYFYFTAALNLIKKLMVHIEIEHQQTLYSTYKSLCQKRSHKNWEVIKEKIQRTILLKQNQIFQTQSERDQIPAQEKKNDRTKRIMVNKVIFLNLLKFMWNHFQGSSAISRISQLLQSYSRLSPPFKDFQGHYFGNDQYIGFLTHESAILFFQIYYFCLSNYSYFLSDGLKNMWIVKANQSSRGRNIFITDSLEQLEPYRNGGNRLIQKYIENVWILNVVNAVQTDTVNEVQAVTDYEVKIKKILHRKFDIRFWVLVKSFCPLQAYIFKQGYLRLSSQSYRFDDGQNSQIHLKTHLTNYTLNYKSSHKQNKTLEDRQQQNSYLLFSELNQYLQANHLIPQHQRDLFQRIKSKINYILQTASDNWRPSQSDANSFQLFGFDIILDSNLQPYVLECNMSPACHERGALKGLVQQMGKGILTLVGLRDSNQQAFFNQTDNKPSRWQPFAKQQAKPSQSQMSKLKNSFSQQQQLTINNCSDFQITGHSFSKKQFANLDLYLNFLNRLVFLQNILKNRYKMLKTALSNKQKDPNIKAFSKVCLLIQKLSRITAKRKHIWSKKFLKYTKKHMKRTNRSLDSSKSQLR